MTDQAHRFCPQCDMATDEVLCPADGSTTLMRHPPHFDLDREAKVGLVVAKRYRLARELGRGGFGAVFGAQHTGTGQQVAIKLLSAQGDLSQQKRFFREARVTAALKSRHTIRVIDFGQDDMGLSYLTMELLTGRTVDAWLAERHRTGQALSEREAVDVGIAVCKSLGEAHNAGLVHRDMKPQNLFCADTEDGPTIKVLDFGIVKVNDQSMTGDSIIGTTNYMSPEQAMSQKLDGRSDLYSLGVVLYELVSNRLPFESELPVQTLVAHIQTPPPPLADRAKSPLSEEFLRIIDVLLAKQPDQRFANAAELLAALVALQPTASTALGAPGAAAARDPVDVDSATAFGGPVTGDATFVRPAIAPTRGPSAHAQPAATSVVPSRAPSTVAVASTAGAETVVLSGGSISSAATSAAVVAPPKSGAGKWLGIAAACVVVVVVAAVLLAGKTPAPPVPAAFAPAVVPLPAAPAVVVPAPAPAAAVAPVVAPPPAVVAPVAAVVPEPAAAVEAPAAPAAATSPKKPGPKKAGANALHRDL